MKPPPTIPCGKLTSLNLDDWNAVAKAFQDACYAPFQQAWLPQPLAGFRPARATAGWTADHLIVYAELGDDDPFNDVTEFNAASFQHGDVFEIFLRPADQEAYFEFHVTPQNQKFQLRLPNSNPFGRMIGVKDSNALMESYKIWKPVIESRVRVDRAAQRWDVVAALPFALMVERTPVQPGVRWIFSFSRYDYTRGVKDPVHSSTSPHPKCNYHRKEDWGTLLFVE